LVEIWLNHVIFFDRVGFNSIACQVGHVKQSIRCHGLSKSWMVSFSIDEKLFLESDIFQRLQTKLRLNNDFDIILC